MSADPFPGAGDAESGEGGLLAAEPVAVILVGDHPELAANALLAVHRLLAGGCSQVLFVAAGTIDYAVLDEGVQGSGGFQVPRDAERMRDDRLRALAAHVGQARGIGLAAAARVALGVDPAETAERVCLDVAGRYARPLFVLGRLVFERRRWFHRILHQDTAGGIQRRLERHGLAYAIVPLVVRA